jgi:hypothetical protein
VLCGSVHRRTARIRGGRRGRRRGLIYEHLTAHQAGRKGNKGRAGACSALARIAKGGVDAD